MRRPRAVLRPYPGVLGCRCHLQRLFPVHVLGGWETPSFCSSYDSDTAWIFCNKLRFLPFIPVSISIPNIWKFQYHLEASKASLGEGLRTLVSEPLTGAPCLAGWGSSWAWLPAASLPTRWLRCGALGCPLAQHRPSWRLEHGQRKELAGFLLGLAAEWLVRAGLLVLLQLPCHPSE